MNPALSTRFFSMVLIRKITIGPLVRNVQKTINSKSMWYKMKYAFSEEKQTAKQKYKEKKMEQQKKELLEMEQKQQNELTQMSQDKKYRIVSRNYKEERVPGLETRKYSDLNQLQKDVIKTNKFDLLNPEIIPKTGASSSYIGITEQLTEISLGGVKIKDENQVFLSEVDPENIPADLDIKFDMKKQLKVVGKQSKNELKQTRDDQKQNQLQMKIQAQTIEQKSMDEHMQQQFGIGVKSYGYDNKRNLRVWDIFLSIVCFAILMPIWKTFDQLNECYESTKAIQDERMKQISLLKQRSYQKVLLENKDFNGGK